MKNQSDGHTAVLLRRFEMREYTLQPDPDAVTFQEAKRLLGTQDGQDAVEKMKEQGWREASHDEMGQPLWFPPEKKD